MMTTLSEIQDTRRGRVPFEVGGCFPRLILPNAEDGSAMSLADFHGQKVMLHIFASW